jgi:hypothetical protein
MGGVDARNARAIPNRNFCETSIFFLFSDGSRGVDVDVGQPKKKKRNWGQLHSYGEGTWSVFPPIIAFSSNPGSSASLV